MSVLLRCDSVSKSFKDGHNDVSVLDNVSFTVGIGEQVAIIGSSGSGKSTLLHILGALDTPTAGSVSIDGVTLTSLADKKQAAFRNQHLGFVYQFHHLLPEFNALENVSMPLLIAGVGPKIAAKQSAEMLERVGLAHRLQHKPNELSGGERQRVAIARALINKPKLVFADEPTGNLDKATGETIAALLTSLRETLNTAFIVVTHDAQLAHQFDRVLTLTSGKLQVESE